MNESTITVRGYVGTEPELKDAGGHSVANFRVACTPRRLNRGSGEWSDAPTQWYSVAAWRVLGENVANSLHKGDPVIIHGRMTANTYVNKSQIEVTVYEIDAISVGHDLNRGRTIFEKTSRTAAPDDRSSEDARAEAMKRAQADWGGADVSESAA